MWDYAEMSKKIKEAGGTDAFLEAMKKVGREQGRLEMLPYALISLGLGIGLGIGVGNYLKGKKDKLDAQAVSIKQEFTNEHCTNELRKTDQTK